jgi:hypothetical protein
MTRGHGERLSRKQSSAIAALLVEKTIRAAADRVGCHEHTIRQWLTKPEFAAAFRAASDAVMAGASNRLQALTDRACDVLAANLDAEKPGDQLRAAETILTHVTKLAEVLDIGKRIAELEAAIATAASPAAARMTNGAVH